MEINSNYNFTYKLVIVGDSSVGKTNIFSKFLKDKIDSNSESSLAVEFGSKIIEIKKRKIKIQIWDTPGQENYKEATKSLYNGALGALLVYDISQKSSINNIDKWISDLKNYGNKNISIILIGNKSDLNNKREISKEEGLKLSEIFNINFIETSAFNGDNINEAFFKLVENIYDIQNNNIDSEILMDNCPPTPPQDIDNCFSCTECSSAIEVLLVDEKKNSIKYKCLKNKYHEKEISLKEYFEIMNKRKKKNDEYLTQCKTHKNKIYNSFCLECNIHLCKDCERTRIHFNHKKNNISEIQPIEEELRIVDQIIKYYKNKLNDLKNEKINKTEELENILKTNKKKEIDLLESLEKQNKINEKNEIKLNNEKFKSDIEDIIKDFKYKIILRKDKYKEDKKAIYNKYKLLNQKDEIHNKVKIEKLNKKFINDLRSFQFEEKIENMENLIKINEIIFNFCNSYHDNYYNSININNLLLNYCDNKYIENKIIKEQFKTNYNEIITLIYQRKKNLLESIVSNYNNRIYFIYIRNPMKNLKRKKKNI